MNTNEIVQRYQLQPHPEGGYFKEEFRSSNSVACSRGERSAMTSIYYLLNGANFSAWHCVLSDETWAYLVGTTDLCIHMISQTGQYSQHRLGKIADDSTLLYTVQANTWFAVEIVNKADSVAPSEQTTFSLVSCIVAPGFCWEDWSMKDRAGLIELFPQHKKIITRFTHQAS